MSELSPKTPAEIELTDIPGSSLTATPTGRLHRFRDWISDLFSSIMVKEARQSLKSYQFFVTYSIVIAAVAIWTVLMFFGDYNTYSQTNSEDLSNYLFHGYCVILGIPLCVIVPFSAFRSLAREYEDGTIQLISITTMKPYQIVLGKLSTAMLQMVIYLSVIAPCIALTYMLDGISYPLIGIVLLIAVGGSIFLTILGLLLAGASRSYAMGMGISVFFILGLGLLYIGWWNLLDEMLGGYGFNANDFLSDEGQLGTYGTTAFFGSIAVVMLTAAAAQISFDSDNRSTPIRIALLFQLTLFVGLLVMIAALIRRPEPMFAMSIFAGHFWLVIGCMLVSEKPGLSNRVQRKLPKSLFGRTFFSLLMPGPGRGYLFAVGCLLASASVSLVIDNCGGWFPISPSSNSSGGPAQPAGWRLMLTASAIVCLYPVFYLSLVYLWMTFLRKYTRLQSTGALAPLIGLVSGFLIVSSISLISYTLWVYVEDRIVTSPRYYSSYESHPSFFGCFNWYVGIFFTGETVFNPGRTGSQLYEKLYYFLPFMAIAIPTTSLAGLLAIRDLRYQPTAAPVRVAEEIERDQAARLSATATLPEGESIDEIFGKLPDKKPPADSD